MASLKYCNHPGCNRLVAMGTAFCLEHANMQRAMEEKRLADSGKNFFASYKREAYDSLYHSVHWKETRKEKLEEEPYCSICGNKATEVHHIKPHRGSTELFFNKANLTSLCHDCHFEITQQEIRDRKAERRGRVKEEKVPKVRKLWY